MLAIAEFVDSDTLIIINFILSAVSALVMLALRSGMRNPKGLLSWAFSNALFAAGFLMLESYLISWPEALSVLGANLLIDAGAMLTFVAVLQFLERSKAHYWLIVPSIALALVEAAIFASQGTDMNVMVRLGVISRSIVTVCAAWQLLRYADPHLRPASTISAVFHLLWVGMLLTRIGWWAWSHFDQVDWDPTTPYALTMRIVLTFVVTPSYLWMVTRGLDHELLQQARQDPLTGIANRRVMWDCGLRTIAMAEQKKTCPGLLMIDVDHFKSVNDRFGHGVGDQVLIGIAQALTNHVRSHDMVARVGGEEFMVLLPDTDHEVAMTIADRLRMAVERVSFPLEDGGTLRCTISMGLSLYVQDASDWEALVLAADRALYCAKRLGRNRVERTPPAEMAVMA